MLPYSIIGFDPAWTDKPKSRCWLDTATRSPLATKVERMVTAVFNRSFAIAPISRVELEPLAPTKIVIDMPLLLEAIGKDDSDPKKSQVLMTVHSGYTPQVYIQTENYNGKKPAARAGSLNTRLVAE